MFRHHGNRRTLKHNLKIASLLSFVAGYVNVVGFLAIQRLTTNVTGHFAFFVDEVFKLNFVESLIYFLYILFYFLGSFVSSLLVEIVSKITSRNIFFLPVILESIIIFLVGIFGSILMVKFPNLIALSLLFAMGLQNSLVTKISNALVRTTHLTGLFTDLGIELSQLFFYKKTEERKKLFSTIKLRLRIIIFFFIGGTAGGILYPYFKLNTLVLPAVILIVGLLYDNLKLKVLNWNRQ